MTTKPKTHKATAVSDNVVPFPVTPDPGHKMAAEAAREFFDCLDPIIMRGFRKQLAEAEAKAAFGDAEAAEEAEYFRLSIKLRLRDREKMIAGVPSTFLQARRAWRAALAARGHHERRNKPCTRWD